MHLSLLFHGRLLRSRHQHRKRSAGRLGQWWLRRGCEARRGVPEALPGPGRMQVLLLRDVRQQLRQVQAEMLLQDGENRSLERHQNGVRAEVLLTDRLIMHFNPNEIDFPQFRCPSGQFFATPTKASREFLAK